MSQTPEPGNINDRVQGTLPPNRAPWHIEHFKLEESEKWWVQEGLSDIPEAGHSILR